MADTVFRKEQSSVLVIEADHTAFSIALSLKAADTTGDGKVSGDEMALMMFDKLPKNLQMSMKTKCSVKDTADLEDYIQTMQKAARVAVNMDILQEVAVPDVPHLCRAATKLGL